MFCPDTRHARRDIIEMTTDRGFVCTRVCGIIVLQNLKEFEMPRRGKSKSQKRGWRWYASMGLNGAVALSMVLGTVFLFTGAPRSTPPTIVPPTIDVNSPTLTPVPPSISTPAAPTPPPSPTPKADAGSYTFAVAGDSRDGDVIYSRLIQGVASDGSDRVLPVIETSTSSGLMPGSAALTTISSFVSYISIARLAALIGAPQPQRG
jgi:hypothetical protein